MKHSRIAPGTLLMAFVLIAGTWTPAAGALSPGELLQLAGRSTYEVVLPKIEPDHVRYEKPLPLELLSFTERNDRFWSIGTAFAIAPDTFVSAAHVLLSAIGGPMGQPYLRDAAGNTFVVDQVLKFSLHEDFIVFRARGATAQQALSINREPVIGDSVFAVGNALGEGVVLRDGLLTSETLEDQDGRWKWLRFSAATSPGNSGGPLLDRDGHVLGVITAKSPGENLNYALPMARVVDAAASKATIDFRSSFGVPILRQQMVTDFKAEFPLPAGWDTFVRTLIDLHDRQHGANQQRLLQQESAELLPRGRSARLLATLERSVETGLIRQQDDDTWGISAPDDEQETELPDGGRLRIGDLRGALSFRLERPPEAAEVSLYRDGTEFMDALLRGLKIPRLVGPQAIRITSLGAPEREERHTDRFGRIWLLRAWTLGYADMQLVTLALPTPEGYSGLIRVAAASGYRQAQNDLRLLADYFHATYRGTLAQWRMLLAERELCPPLLRGLRLDDDESLSLGLRGLQAQIPRSLLKLDDRSELVAYTTYRAEGDQLRSDLGGMTLSVRPEDASWIGIWSQARPGSGAGSKLEERWRQLVAREGEFAGTPQHDARFTHFWSTSVVGDGDGPLMYEVVASWLETGLLPRHVTERRERLLSGLQVKPDEVR